MTARPCLAALALLAAAWWRPLAAPAAEGYACAFRGSSAPRMDGRIEEDPFWNSVARSSDLRLLGRDRAASPLATWFKIAYTGEALYIGVWCEEPRMDSLRADAEPGGDPWTDDSIEVFLAVPSVQPYLHLVVNTKGVRYNGRGIGERVEPLPWTCACFKGSGAYSIEIRVPYTTLLAAPAAGACWPGNVCRNVQTVGSRAATWAPLLSGFHEASGLAPLVFPVGVASRQAEALLRGRMLAGIRDRQRRTRTLFGPGERGRFQARLLDAPAGLIERRSAAASTRMLATLQREQGRTLDRAGVIVAQRRDAWALRRAARLFEDPAGASAGGVHKPVALRSTRSN